MQLQPEASIATLRLESIVGRTVQIPPETGDVCHLQFRRFAGCPICNLHLRSLARRMDEIRNAGVREVVVFHSAAETMRPFQGDLPFDVVADPEKRLYAQFGVEASARSILHPKAWIAYAKGSVARHPSNATVGEGGHLGLPADFLIDGSGRIVACKYGRHADDQWSVDELLALAANGGAARTK